MSDIYKIAVRLTMESNAAAVLGALSKEFLHIHTQVRELEGGFARLNRVKLAVFGGLAIAAGTGLLGMVKATVDASKELNKQLTNTAVLMADPKQSAALQAQALSVARSTTNAVRGVALDKAVEIFNESYSVVGAANAAKINTPLAMYAKVAGATDGNYDKAYDTIRELLKSGEMTGKIMNEKTHLVDNDKLLGYLDMAAKVTSATAGRVNAKTFFQIAQQGSAAVRDMSGDGMLGMLMASQQMGGFRVGTSTMSLFSQFAGGKMTKPVAEELHRLGLVGDFDVEKGGGVKFHKGALDTDFTKQLRKDPLSSINTLRSAMSAHGIEGEKQGEEMFKIFGRQTVQRLMTDLMLGMENMVAERGRIKGAQGLKQQNDTRDDHDYDTNLHNMQEAWHNLMMELGNPLTKSAIDILHKATDGIQYLTGEVVKLGPEKIRAIGEGIAIFGAALVGAGGVALVLALGPAGWIVLGIGTLIGIVKAVDPTIFSQVASGVTSVFNAIKSFVSWFSAKALPAPAGGKSLGDDLGLPGLEHESYDGTGFGGLYKETAYASGGGSDSPVAQAVKSGVLDAFRALMGDGGASGGAGGGTGLMNASWGGGGGGGFAGGTWNGRTLSVGSGTGVGHVASQTERAAYIRATAASLGIDPNTALRVAQSEGFYQYTGDQGRSFGDFQMFTGGGLGNIALSRGINIRDPHNWKAADRLALEIAAQKHSWADWHGARKVGIGDHQGFGVGRPPRQQAITIHNHTHLDGKQVAKSVTRHQIEAATMPTAIGGHDGYGSYLGAGSTTFGT